jgi:fatty acid amide hydrolase 2
MNSQRASNLSPLLTQSATELARRIRAREVTSLEVVNAHIALIEAENPRLNAVVQTRFVEAREEARAADARVALEDASTLPPLHGVPCTIKESFFVNGMRSTGGLLARQHNVASEDAVVVRRVRDAGAIVLGTTNVSELCMWMESENQVYGRTSNPYDATRGVGGSSGGEGASVSAGFAPFGLGADVGGSIRIPAFMNGIYGHKATGGLIPNAGQYPMVTTRILASGPLCRRAEDLMPLMRLLVGPDASSPECEAMPFGDPSEVSFEGMRVLSVDTNGVSRVHPELRAAQHRLAAHLSSRGAHVETRSFARFKKSVLYWSAAMSSAGSEDYAVLLGNGTRIQKTRELMRMLTGRSPFTVPSMALALIEDIPKLLPDNSRAMLDEMRAFRAELEDAIGDGVMLFPGYSAPAPKHRAPWASPVAWAYTAIFNVTEMPATQVPLGLSREGLPLGCQVVGARGADHRTIAVALEVERAMGGWVAPPHLAP